MSTVSAIPEVDSIWVSPETGEKYAVIGVSNLIATRDGYPVTVHYQRLSDGSTWSVPLDRWLQSKRPLYEKRQEAQSYRAELERLRKDNFRMGLQIEIVKGIVNQGFEYEPGLIDEEYSEGWHDKIRALVAEVARLTECLSKANSQAERFERHWYLRGDEIEALTAEVARLREPAPLVWVPRPASLGTSRAICSGDYEIVSNELGSYASWQGKRVGVISDSEGEKLIAACEAHHAARYRAMQKP